MVTVVAALTIGLGTPISPSFQRVGPGIQLPNTTRTLQINGKDVLVSARRTVFISIEEGKQKTTEHHRAVLTRPERPSRQVSLQGRFEVVPEPGGGDTIVDMFFSQLMSNGVSPEIGPQVFRALESTRKSMAEQGEKATTLVDPTPGTKPNGWTERRWQLEGHDVRLKFEVAYEYEGHKDLNETVEFCPSVKIGAIWRPDAKFYLERFYPDLAPVKEKQTSVGGVTFPAVEGRPAVQFDLPIFGDGERYSPLEWGGTKSSINLGGYFHDVQEANGTDKVQKFLSGHGLMLKTAMSALGTMAPRGNDMNALNFTVPEDPCDMDFDAPPGLLWLPSEPGYQSMTNGVRYRYAPSFYAHMGLDDVLQSQTRMRTLCLNMSLKEPAPNVMYFPYRPSDPMLREIGRLMDESSFRGPWDQARAWIYTDHATMEEINIRMAPPLNVGQYAMGLGDIGRLGGLTEADLKNPGMFRPDLIAGASAPPATLAWVVSVILDRHSDALVKYLDGGAAELKALAVEGAAKYQTDTLSMSLRACTDSPKGPVRVATLKWLVKNASGLGAVKGRVGDLRESLYSGDAEEVGLAKAVIAAGLAVMPKDAQAFLDVTGS